MKIRKDIYLEKLENYGYHYQSNLIYAVYTKVETFGNAIIVIDILIKNRTIYINKSSYITERNVRFINDLKRANLIEK